jgi:hypothetical protein
MIQQNFPELCWTLPQYLLPAGGVAIEEGDRAAMKTCLSAVESLTAGQEEVPELLQLLQISLVLAIITDRRSRDFEYRFREMKGKLQHANLQVTLPSSPLLSRLSTIVEDVTRNFLLQQVHDAKEKWLHEELAEARRLIDTIKNKYPDCWTLPQYLLPAGGVAIEEGDRAAMKTCLSAVESLTAGQEEVPELVQLLQISLVLAIITDRSSPDFEYRFGELKAKLQHANLLAPLSPSPLLPQFTTIAEAKPRRLTACD